MDVGSNNSLQVVSGDEKGIQCLGIELDNTVRKGIKYVDPEFQVGGGSRISESRTWS
jgi:hypothetical protein